MPQIPGHLAEFLGNSLGVAAVLLVGGWLALRWQQDRHRFQLMQTALEKGITRFPDAPPFWLLSMRQGVTMLATGIALAAVGGGAFWLGRQAPMPATSVGMQFEPAGPPTAQDAWQEREDRRDRGPDRRPQGRPDDAGFEQDRGPRPDLRPGRPNGPPDRRPMLSPQMERWHQAQTEQTAGLISLGVGIILMLVGVVRVFFAQAERQLGVESRHSESSF